MCLAQADNTLSSVTFELANPQSQVEHSTIELLIIWASTRQSLSWRCPTKRNSNQSPQLQRQARKLNFAYTSLDMILAKM